MTWRCVLLTFLFLLPPTADITAGLAAPGPPPVAGEVVSTPAVVEENILYAASYELPVRVGHLRAIALNGGRQTRLWDAAERVPLPGDDLPPPTAREPAALAPQFGDGSGVRRIFTNLDAAQGFRLLTFEAQAAYALQPLLGVATVAEATALINTVRGRLGASASMPAGSGDRPNRLGAISCSAPALVGDSPLVAGAALRDQVLYAGAEDGLLHAILAGRRHAVGSGYDHAAEACGGELWGYLPGSLLPFLTSQPFDAPGQLPAVHVDGSPAVGDLYFDADGDGRREWRTILVGTASIRMLNRGVVFALDVTEPRAPRLLWETSLAEIGFGRSRGAALGGGDPWGSSAPRVFLTAGTADRVNREGVAAADTGSYGALACALDLATGRLLWRFVAPYAGTAGNRAAPPSLPSLITTSGDGGIDGVVFGDLAGRLWLLDPDNGAPRGGEALWQTPGGVDEPIGAGVAVRNRLVLFGTGTADDAADQRSYAVYAVEILAASARLLWTHPLEPGEKLWGAPTFDRFGRAYLGVGFDQAGEGGESGRLLTVAGDGRLMGSTPLAGPPQGGLALAPGAIVTVSRSGEVEQFGELQQTPSIESRGGGRVRVLSWRVR